MVEKKLKTFFVLIILSLCAIDSWSYKGVWKVRVLYFNRPPYYVFTKTGPRGIIMDKVVRIFRKAGIKAEYVLSSPSRIILSFKRGERNICSPGWFKCPEREKFAKFSSPIYQDLPLVLLTSREEEIKFKGEPSIVDVFKNKDLVWGRISSFSYGNFVHKLYKEIGPRIIQIDGTQLDLVRMLKYKRFSYILISPEQVNYLVKSAGYDLKDFKIICLRDVPYGNKRYLMFSKDVLDKMIKQINLAIKSLCYYK